MANELNALIGFSDALAERTAAAAKFVTGVRLAGAGPRSGVLWRPDLVVLSEQSLPDDAENGEAILPGGGSRSGKVVGRDTGSNVALFKLDAPHEAALPTFATPRVGELALAFGSNGQGGATVRMGTVEGVGAEWYSRAGGRIERRVFLGLLLPRRSEGGPVTDTRGQLIGFSTFGPRRRTLVIPPETVERVIEPLLANGRIARGWLGLALHPVAIGEELREPAGGSHGLMAMQVVTDGPAAKAGIVAGDILVSLDGVPAARWGALARKLGQDSVGKELDVRLIRAGAITSQTVTVGARPQP